MRINHSVMAVGFFLLLSSASAQALTLDFEEFDHGDYVFSSQGVVISTTNLSSGPDLGVAFDTTRVGTADQDLQFLSPGIPGGQNGWKSGNLAPDTFMGNILIIQEHSGSCSLGNCSNPDDEGSRPAGRFEMDFSALGTFDEFAMDLIDVENVNDEPGMVEFFLGAVLVETVDFMDFLLQPGVAYGDNSANSVDVVDGTEFDRVVIHMGGSGGVDNIVAKSAVPEPGAAMLFAIGAGVVGARLRRR